MSESIPPQSGRVIAGKYKMGTKIGEGAMGEVWTATHLHLGRKVAIKLVAPELAEEESARLRFTAEAKAAAALKSKFVVHIYDAGITDEGIPYLEMEYLAGESLEDRVEKGGPLALDYAVNVVSQIARGLARAHAVNIVHRDLKPANVFLAETDDGEEVAKILDFGVAKIRKDGPAQSATATGAVVGTPLFMSPEQARGLKTVDHRSDLYSLGMLAFWILTGQHAFSGEAFGDLILAICTQPLPSPHEIAPWLPEELDGWFRKACALEPEDRYQSPQELIEGLIEAAGVNAADMSAIQMLSSPNASGRFALASSPDLLADIGGRPVATAGGADTVLANATAAGLARSSGGGSPRNWTPLLIAAGVLAAVGMGGGLMLVASSGSTPPSPAAPAQEPARPAASPVAVPAADEPVVSPEPATAADSSALPAEPSAEPEAEPVQAQPVRPIARPAPAAASPQPKPRPAPKPPGEIDIGF